MSWKNDAVILVARTVDIHALVKRCAAGELPFEALCGHVRKMGFNTTSLYEMVVQQERFMAEGKSDDQQPDT